MLRATFFAVLAIILPETGLVRLSQRLKYAAGSLLFSAGIHRRLLRNRALIVIFHRIDDRLPENGISLVRDQFVSFCRFFRRYFDVIELSELLGRIERKEPLGGLLAVTFDDGYRDNHETAADVLEEFGLPATFFIATDFIGTTRVPWWDAQRGIDSEWMTWDEVASLSQRGFSIGSHTANHVDLGEIQGEEAYEEIQRGRDVVNARLGPGHDLFSYPYGRRNQLTEENREYIRSNGFRCCLSAYGGSVRSGDDLFRLNRIPVGRWFATPQEFGFDAAFDRL